MNRTTSCVHHWIIAAASSPGPTSEMPAQCRNCGAERVFHNTTSRPAFVPYGSDQTSDEYRFGTRSSRREEFRLSDQ